MRTEHCFALRDREYDFGNWRAPKQKVKNETVAKHDSKGTLKTIIRIPGQIIGGMAEMVGLLIKPDGLRFTDPNID